MPIPEERNIAVVENDEYFIRKVQEVVSGTGWIIVAIARTFPEAIAIVPNLTEMRVSIALVDANLSENASDNLEGFLISRRIHQEAPDVKVVGYSGNYPQEGVDIQMGKEKLYTLPEILRLHENV